MDAERSAPPAALEFVLHGQKLKGRFALIHMNGRGSRTKENWFLIKMKDEFAQRESANGEKPARAAKPRRRKPASPPSMPRSTPPPKGVTITHPDKVLYPDAGITKGEVVDNYRRIAPRLLSYLRDRPVTLERVPEGLGNRSPHFWQKDIPAHYPSWVPRVELSTERGKPVHYALVNDVDTLLYLVNQNTLTFHVWFSRIQDLDRPDFVLFDLDPGQATFADAVAVAQELHSVLKGEGQSAFVKTSGKTGLHVIVPWEAEGGYDATRAWAQGLGRRVAQTLPKQATVETLKAKRGRRVYVDVLQNARGHHAVPPYVPGAPVSTPLSWPELTPDLDPARFNLKTIFRRLARQRRDPMAALIRGLKGVQAS